MDMENNIIFNKNWVSWLVGFIDAEGNFQIYPKKRVLTSGKIARYNVGFSFHLSLNKKSDLLYLIDNIFEKYPLITKNQSIRYYLLKNWIINDITEFKTLEEYQEYKTNSLLSITEDVKIQSDNLYKNLSIDNWIIGFINGEGCFYLNKNKCNFFIEHTDKQALELIKNRLTFGPNVLERSKRDRDLGKVRKTTYQLIVSSKKDLNSLVMLLDNNNNIPLQGNKYKQYQDWKQYLNK